MNRILLSTLLLMLALGLAAQSVPKMLQIADELYQNYRYLEAIEFYDKIAGIDKTNYFARFQLANAYHRTLQYEKAKQEFLKLSNTEGHDYRARSLYNYANLVKQESQFKVADSIYYFLITLPDAEPYLVELARKQREGCQLALRQKKADRGFSVHNFEEINSRFHDFGAVVNPSNKLVVLATTRNLPGVQYEGSQYEGLLPDLVAFEHRANDRWRLASSEQRFSSLNTQWGEGSGTFTRDGQTFYFSSCRGEEGADCGIMVSYLVDGYWSEPIFLNEYINESGAENKHPSISATGDTLFFVSNRTGGVGGSDIWMSLKGLEKESWTPAINMGAVINTPEDEITPYYSSAFECLLFASDGHVGYGGFDLFAAKGESFFEPEIYNLGDPFNSTWDDTYFNISDTVGFLATNRADHEILNINYFDVSNERLFLSLLISGESLIDSRLASKFKDIRSLDLVTYRVEDYAGYDLFEPIRPSKPKPKILQGNQQLAGQVQELAYERLFFDYGLASLRPEAKRALESLADQIQDKSIESINILAYTDSIGPARANLLLSKNRGLSAKEYLIALGVDSAKIKVLPRGELPSEGANDHWFKRILKRRVEIIVKSFEPIGLVRATPYIVRKPTTLSNLANRLGVAEQQLIQWNGEDRKLMPGETLRIMSGAVKGTPVQVVVGEEDFPLFTNKSGKSSQ